MAAPTYQAPSLFATDAGGAWSFSAGFTPQAIGDVWILQIVQDGTTGGAVTLDSATFIENLAGTDNAWTFIGSFNVGNPTAAIQHLWIGRNLSTTPGQGPTATGSNSTSEDLYVYFHEFLNVNTGTTLASVIENTTAGSTTNTVGTSSSVDDAAVVTIGPDRLACNFVALNDDAFNTGPAFDYTGESGGTWTTQAVNHSASGTDGGLACITAPMASAATIDGGSGSLALSAGWGVVGFALIGTTVASAAEAIVHMAPHIPT